MVMQAHSRLADRPNNSTTNTTSKHVLPTKLDALGVVARAD